MYALTVKQPFATAILRYGKNVENRTWSTHYRGRIYIHSSARDWCEDDAFNLICSRLGTKRTEQLWQDPMREIRGAVLGYVELVDVIHNATSKWRADGCAHWILQNPVVLRTPIPAFGKTRLWHF